MQFYINNIKKRKIICKNRKKSITLHVFCEKRKHCEEKGAQEEMFKFGNKAFIAWQGIATVLLSVAALGGAYFLSDGGEAISVAPSSYSYSSLPKYSGPSMSASRGARTEQSRTFTSATTFSSTISHPTVSHGVSTGVTPSVASAPYPSMAFGELSKGSSSGGGNGGGSATGGKSSSGGVVGAPRASGVTAVAATAPKVVRRASVNQGSLIGKPFGELEVYEGDGPGVITGQENSTMDNPIVTSYDQPIGDVLWPMLLMALGYVAWVMKRSKECIRQKP